MEHFSSKSPLRNSDREEQTIREGKEIFSRYAEETGAFEFAPAGVRNLSNLHLRAITDYLFPDGLPPNCRLEVLAAAATKSAAFELLVRLSDERGRTLYPGIGGQIVDLGILGGEGSDYFAGMIVSLSQSRSPSQEGPPDSLGEIHFEWNSGGASAGESDWPEVRRDIFAGPLLSRQLLLSELKRFREGDFGGVIGAHIYYYLSVMRDLSPQFKEVAVAASENAICLESGMEGLAGKRGKIPNEVDICYALRDADNTDYIVTALIHLGPHFCGAHTFTICYAAPLGVGIADQRTFGNRKNESLASDLRERWKLYDYPIIADSPADNAWLRTRLCSFLEESLKTEGLTAVYAHAVSPHLKVSLTRPTMEAVAAFRDRSGRYVIADGLGARRNLVEEAGMIFAARCSVRALTEMPDPNIVGLTMSYDTFERQIALLGKPEAGQSIFHARVKNVIQEDLRKRNRDDSGLYLKPARTAILLNNKHTQIRPDEWIGEDVAVLLCPHTAGTHEILIRRLHLGGMVRFETGIRAANFFEPRDDHSGLSGLNMPPWEDIEFLSR